MTDFQQVKQVKHSKLIIKMSPTAESYNTIRAEYLKQTGTDNIFENRDLWWKLIEDASRIITLNDISFVTDILLIFLLILIFYEINY